MGFLAKTLVKAPATRSGNLSFNLGPLAGTSSELYPFNTHTHQINKMYFLRGSDHYKLGDYRNSFSLFWICLKSKGCLLSGAPRGTWCGIVIFGGCRHARTSLGLWHGHLLSSSDIVKNHDHGFEVLPRWVRVVASPDAPSYTPGVRN